MMKLICKSISFFTLCILALGCTEQESFEPSMAAYHNDVLAMRTYLKSGGNPNLIDQYGQSLVYVATGPKGGDEVLKLLLEYGADPNLGAGSYTPLMNAASGPRLKSVKLLIEAGADVSRRNSRGQTALDRARSVKLYGAYRGQEREVIEFLSKLEKQL